MTCKTTTRLLLSTACLPAFASCAGPARSGGAFRPRDASAEATLLHRAETLWRAKSHGDCKTAYQFADPAYRNDEAAYIEWCKNEDPFRILEYKLHGAQAEGDLGWVRVVSKTQFVRIPGTPVQEVDTWDKWRRIGGEWLPVNKRELAAYPEAPAVRDHAAEQRVRARLDEVWQSRLARDWHRLYELIDPLDRSVISEDQLIQSEDMLVQAACKVCWVEVTGDRGRTRATYSNRLNDPSLSKMPLKDTDVTEYWVLRDGAWYLDLKRP